MEIRMPKAGDIYRHFKGNLYEVIIIARDSETLEEISENWSLKTVWGVGYKFEVK